MTERKLDIENIGRIGQMFVNGDLLERVMADPYTCDEDDTDYNIDAANPLKATLSKIEGLNPDLYVTGVLYARYPANKRMAIPAIAGRTLPKSGWNIAPCDDGLYQCMTEGVNTIAELWPGETTRYFPIRNSLDVVVGALALTTGGTRDLLRHRIDIW